MGSLLARATSGEALLRAWADVRDSAYADGEPGGTVLAFEHHALRELTQLATAISDDTYEPRPMTRISIPKSGGGSRDLAVGAVADRVVERALLTVLDPLVDPLLSPWCFAYRRGLGVKDAARALVEAREDGARFVVRTDFDECFDQIPRWAVLRRLGQVVADPELLSLVQRLVGRPVIGEPSARGLGLHQGAGLSPLLANLYLDTFDQEMIKLGYRPIRYGDDIAMPVEDRPSGERLLELATVRAAAIHLRLEDSKSQVVSYDDGVPFCGRVVTATSGPTHETRSRPLPGTVFVTSEGALLRSRGQRLRVEVHDELLASINFKRVRQIVCVGRVGVTSTLLRRVTEKGVDLAWLYDDGRYAGRLTPLSGGDPELRLAQYRVVVNQARALRIARRIVAGKITNMRVGLLRAARARQHLDLADRQRRLAAARVSASTAENTAMLMGCEGAATRDYFAGLSAILGEEWEFTSRRRRPPPDPVNAMLSFGYTLLVNEAVAACVLAGLDPYLGMLHSPHRNRPSLALDLIEEMRPVIVDAMVVRVVRTGQLTPANFTTTEDHGCRLDEAGRRSFLAAYERRMLTLVHHPVEGRRISWRHALNVQARRIAAVVEDHVSDYDPVVWK